MIVRNGVRTTVRARGRTILFSLLILMLTLTLALGTGMWAYCGRTLAQMNRSYTSIALVEYLGSDYPDGDAADDAARRAAAQLDSGAVAALDGVKLWEENDRTLAWAEGYERTGLDLPYGDYGVVVVSSLAPVYQEMYVEIPEEELPEEYFVVTDRGCTLRTQQLQAEDVPLLYLDETGVLFQERYDENEGWVKIELSEEELPETFVYLKLNIYQYVLRQDGTDYAVKAEQLGWSEGAYYGYRTGIYGYTGLISKSIYTREGKDNVAVMVEIGDSGFSAERGQRYLLHGKFVDGTTANRTFAVADFYPDCPTRPWLAVDGYDDPAFGESIFTQYAALYRTANNHLNVEASDDVAALELFQQGTLYLEEGRFPAAGEPGVCVLSGDAAKQLGLGLGDLFSCRRVDSGEENRFEAALTGEDRALTVVGITNTVKGYSGLVWVSGAEGGFEGPLFGYCLGRAVLENPTARKTADAIQAMAPGQVRVTLLDQGYSAAAQPLETMKTTAMAVTAAAACGTLAVLFLFAFLFVGRQRETVSVLVSLGTPGGKIRLWLLSGVFLVSGGAALAGAVLGGLLLNQIVRLALSAARDLYAVDQRYSEAAVGVARTLGETEGVPLWPAWVAGVSVFALAMVLCLLFLSQTRRASVPKRGKLSVRVPKGGTSLFGRGAGRFALLSVRRGGWRSGVVPAAALVLSLFLGILASNAQGWSGQMDALYRQTDITGQVSSSNGRQFTGLAVSAENARTLWRSGMLEEEYVSLGWNYWVDGEMPAFGGGSFAQESRADWIAKQPDLIALNHMSAAPEFFYEAAPEISWLDGWDESFLSDTEYPSFLRSLTFWAGKTSFGGAPWPTYPCLVSQSFLDSHNLSLGDEFSVNMVFRYSDRTYDFLSIPLKAVGSFAQMGAETNLYVPLSFWCDPAWVTGAEDVVAQGQRPTSLFETEEERDVYFYSNTMFGTCRFALKSAYVLEEFRAYLAELRFSQAGKLNANRTTVLLRDQAFTETVGGLGRYITFGKILFPVLFLVVGLLGFVISWLMVNGRRMEFAMMRGLGASRGRVFCSFFLEQGLLCLAGCALGCLALAWLPGGGAAQWLAVLLFFACYLAGCALSVLAVGRTHLMSLLSERE